MKLVDKRILITGGTSGIGLEMVRQLYRQNEVIVIARKKEKMDRVLQQLPGVVGYPCDLAETKAIEQVSDKLTKQFSHIDVLINNAAIQTTPTFLEDQFCYETIPREINVNFTAICLLTYQLLPSLLAADEAVILNINSGLAITPKRSSAVYCATKGALNLFSQSLRYQLEGTSIQVLQAFLDLVDTPMTADRGGKMMSADYAAERILLGVEKEIAEIDLGRVKLLRLLARLSPGLARRIMKGH